MIAGGVAEVTYKGYRWKYPNGPRLPAFMENLLKGKANSALESVGIQVPTAAAKEKEKEEAKENVTSTVKKKRLRRKEPTGTTKATTTTTTITKKQVGKVVDKKLVPTKVASCTQVSDKDKRDERVRSHLKGAGAVAGLGTAVGVGMVAMGAGPVGWVVGGAFMLWSSLGVKAAKDTYEGNDDYMYRSAID